MMNDVRAIKNKHPGASLIIMQFLHTGKNFLKVGLNSYLTSFFPCHCTYESLSDPLRDSKLRMTIILTPKYLQRNAFFLKRQ